MTRPFTPENTGTLIYRGVNGVTGQERIGPWWTTNPFLALDYVGTDDGSLFVASMDGVDGLELGSHQKIEDHPLATDPSDARLATLEQLAALTEIAAQYELSDQWPDNYREIGRIIFTA